MRILYITGVIFFTATLFYSCEKPSNLPITPAISFKSFYAVNSDSARLEINFTDGDGDIGYPSQDASASPNLWIKYLYYNYTDKKFEGVQNLGDPDTFDTIYFTYHIPDLTPAGKNKSLTGIIEVAIAPQWYLKNYSTLDSNIVEYQIWLFDRAGHKSNAITAGPFQGL